MRSKILSCLLGGFVCGWFATEALADQRVSFNQDIRPILSDRCYTCHGPDPGTREGNLRFDREESAKGDETDSGLPAIVAGEPDMSEIMSRLTDSDPDTQMPPPHSNLKVSPDEIALIRRWIAEGANWEKHWSFTTPRENRPPAVNDESWPINAIDRFVLRRLEEEGMKPTPVADRARWLRRVTFDLTGLPPTLEELDAFLADKSEMAFENVVDRLLDSRAFGQRMALEWLDLARYGDTDGLFEDHPRSVYPWRDWVVDAFNQNLPYDEFITWQIAGDLLPDATIDQRIATGFLRHNPTSNEGGIINEDYRVKYLVDRVNTTATSMMGLTLECAQCHDHKYDPMTQREYFQFAGFFNSLVGGGNTKGSTAPTLRRYDDEQASRIPVIDAELATIEEKLKTTPDQLTVDFQRWSENLDRPIRWNTPELIAGTRIRETDGWLVEKQKQKDEPDEPTRPTFNGRYVRLEMPKNHVGFLTLSEVKVFVGGKNIARSGKASQSSVGYNSPASKAIDGDDSGRFTSCSCTNSEANAWWEIDLGAEFAIESVSVFNRTDCCPERLDNLSIDVLNEQRESTGGRKLSVAGARSAFPKDAVDGDAEMEEFSIDLRVAGNGKSAAVAALQFESRLPGVIELVGLELVSSDEAGKNTPIQFAGDRNIKLASAPVIVGLDSVADVSKDQWFRVKVRAIELDGLRIKTTDDETAALRASLPKETGKRLEHYRAQWPGFKEDRERQKNLVEEKNQIDASAPLSMIAGDVSPPRKNFLLERGEYDKRGEEVPTSALESIMPFGARPATRIGLASWLTDPKHPLTARVAVNRYWQMLFGTGIVKTSEDFGSQGEAPSHQELLDHLAVGFVRSGWDVKRLLRQITLSATYRQASFHAVQMQRLDPENRLLWRGPRRRLPAEFLRDHSLSISGLLKNRFGGPGVHPYQPAELFGANAIGSSRGRFIQSTGDDLYRRSLYTYWKRQIPAANMRILGADGRTTCRTRRERTNTPLQALVLLNDPQFIEAARVLAERIMADGGSTPEERLGHAFRLATSRHAKIAEVKLLVAEYQDRLNEFQADEESAAEYLAGGGEHKPNVEANPVELAAYAAVCSLIINLDESMSCN